MKRALIAFGGNALIKAGELGLQQQQVENAKAAAEVVVKLVEALNVQPILVHGNGPQVGNILIQQERAANRVPPYTMDICGAQTQGSVGYLLQRSIENRLQECGRKMSVATVLTEVVVDADDPGFAEPSKPVGPFYQAFRAHELAEKHGWVMREDAGRGWRRLVPSPKPLQIVQLSSIRALLDCGHLVIACGGGGIPVVRDRHGFQGVEAVIDKDRTATLLAKQLGAEILITLTAVDKVSIHFGQSDQKTLDRLTVAEARKHLAAGEFPAGSMGPKVEAAVDFVSECGGEVWITSAEALLSQPLDSVGTRIVAT